MAAEPFLTIDDQPLSLTQALRYLQSSGKLQQFMGEILRQYRSSKNYKPEQIWKLVQH